MFLRISQKIYIKPIDSFLYTSGLYVLPTKNMISLVLV